MFHKVRATPPHRCWFNYILRERIRNGCESSPLENKKGPCAIPSYFAEKLSFTKRTPEIYILLKRKKK